MIVQDCKERHAQIGSRLQKVLFLRDRSDQAALHRIVGRTVSRAERMPPTIDRVRLAAYVPSRRGEPVAQPVEQLTFNQ